jgi:hypothetical protein
VKRGKVSRALAGSFRLCPCSRCVSWEQRASERCDSCMGARQVVIGAPTIKLRRSFQMQLAQETRRRVRIERRTRWSTSSAIFNG